ncbi:hypothetical protein [Mycolicibacterium fortuitum]|uniref:hypothetical protein n=1 Tax=Mycolicibacterium fortuitum TaxID=1766 RepID=UPI003AAA481A
MIDEIGAGPGRWSDFSRPVFDFAVVLRDAEVMPYDEDEYWDKPHKWDREHQLWLDAGSPSCPDPGEPPTLSWQRFLRSVGGDGDDDE